MTMYDNETVEDRLRRYLARVERGETERDAAYHQRLVNNTVKELAAKGVKRSALNAKAKSDLVELLTGAGYLTLPW